MDLLKIQEDMEDEAVAMGIKRYHDLIAKRGVAGYGAGAEMLRQSVEPLAQAITQWIERVRSGKATKNANLVTFLDQYEPAVVAYVTARVALDAIATKTRLQTVSVTIAKLLEEHLNTENLKVISKQVDADRVAKGDHPLNIYKRFCDYLEKQGRNTQTHRLRAMLIKVNHEYTDMKPVRWDLGDRVKVGTLLLELFSQSTGLINIVADRVGKESFSVIRSTPSLDNWLKESHGRCELLHPVHLPMVVPPMPWINPFQGGYLKLKSRMVIKRNKRYHRQLEKESMPMVYETLNAIQNTAWKINPAVLRVVHEVWALGGGRAGLPEAENRELPAKIPGMDDDPDVLRSWKQAACEVHTYNHRIEAKRMQTLKKMSLAERFAQFPAIYFPHVLDWRGRIYCLPGYLNPQGDDLSKGLLHFAEGVPLGTDGAYWLAVHGANCYGVDKVSYDERVAWVQEHQEEILASAADPLSNTFWMSTDDNPWMFLAFCFEWMGFVLQGESYVSHLPIAFDGSCNGLQNFSAALRDQVGGAATNLVPADRPSDIYQLVADKAAKYVKEDALNGKPEAKLWDGKVARWVAKRPTMTMPYGSERYGYRDQLIEEVKKRESKSGQPVFDQGSDKFAACAYMSYVIDDALKGTVVKASEAMAWLRQVAKIAAKNGQPLYWTAPSGFLVMQDYKKIDGKKFDFLVAGRRVQLWMNVEGEKLDARKMGQAVAPNVIHSFDAAHLCRTVSYAREAGIQAFAMVHDSYGTHAGKCGDLAVLLRQAFIDQYQGNLFEEWLDEIKAQLPDDLREQLPPAPEQGTLDLELINQSEYFFA